MQREDQRRLIHEYKQRKMVGGIYIIKNTRNGKALLEMTLDMAGSRNRFVFAQKNNNTHSLKLQKDWDAMGAESFCFEALEELEKGENQSVEDFRADIKILRDMWLEKLASTPMY